jgi:ABC-type Zn uptake system ZnuABC Zn-binding protein ZnuA
VFAILVTSLPGCSGNSVKKPAVRVVCGTTLISSIVQEIGGGRLDAISIKPPEQNPNDFVVKPEKITLLSGAIFFIIHDWQQAKFSQSVIDSAENPGLKVATVKQDGDWMIPELQSRATDKVLGALKSIDIQNSTAYDAGAAAYHQKIVAQEKYIKDTLGGIAFNQPLSFIDAIIAAPATDFVKYIGLNVIATYDKLTPERQTELVKLGREKGTKIVVDTFQNGANMGANLSVALAAARATLSSYPGGAPYTANWEDSVVRSMRSIIGVLEESD